MQESERTLLPSGDLNAALTSVFGPLDDGLLEALSREVEIVDLPGGAPLFHQNGPADSLYILLRGRLNVISVNPATGAETLLGETTPGESIGEIGLLTGEPRSASLWATRDCQLARISREAFDGLAEENPELLRGLARVVVELLRKRTSTHRTSPQISTIALVPARSDNGTREFASDLSGVLAEHGSALHVNSDRIDSLVGVSGVASAKPGSAGGARLGSWLSEAESKNRFLILEADAEPTEWTQRCIRQADIVLNVGNSADDPSPVGSELSLSQGRAGETPVARGIRQVLVLLHPDGGEPIRGTAQWLDMRSVDEHHHVRDGIASDLERLGRIIAGTAVGLVLGGGGARGFAHAGVYRALVEHGIPIDWVGGSSIGAVFCAGIGMGWDPQRVEDEARRSFVSENPFGDFTVPLVALLSGKRIDRMAERSFSIDIEDMPIPYFCISSDLTSSSLTVHERGVLWRAIRASVSLPGVFPPAVNSKHLAIDGGILNNLPVDIMRERSVGKVIACDLSVAKEYELDYQKVPSSFEILLARLPFTRKLRVPGIVTLMMKATVMASAVHSRSVRADASLLFQPPVGRFGLLATNDFEEIVDVGYQHARERLEEWSRD